MGHAKQQAFSGLDCSLLMSGKFRGKRICIAVAKKINQ